MHRQFGSSLHFLLGICLGSVALLPAAIFQMSFGDLMHNLKSVANGFKQHTNVTTYEYDSRKSTCTDVTAIFRDFLFSA